MATHYCIGNPCWICHPEHGPKPEEHNFTIYSRIIEDFRLHDNKLSGLLRNLLVEVFEGGLDEDTHYRAMGDLTLEDMKAERAKIPNDSLEAELLDLMIKDYEVKGDGH